MPIYSFKCPSCNQQEEIIQNMTDDNPICERCVKSSCGLHVVEMQRIYTNVGKPQFKGNGFYETDYKKKGGG